MNILLTDSIHINNIDYSKYDKVYLVGYAKNDIDNLLEIKNTNSKIEVILPSSNFDNAYYFINKHIATLVNGNIELLSLFKLCKQDLFNMGMILVALNKVKLNFSILTTYDEYLFNLNIIKKKNLCTNIQVKNRYKVNYVKQIVLLLAINLKVIFMYLKSFFIKSKNLKKLLMDYPAKKVMGVFESDEDSLLIKLDECGDIITYSGLKIFFKQQKKLLTLSLKYKILHQIIAKQSYYLLKIISLVNYYNPKLIVGALDASAMADIYSIILKQYNVKFGCYSHGFNYDFRMEYIYIPFDFYFVWSKAHLKQVKSGNYIQSDCKFYITGSPFYKDVNFDHLKQQSRKEIYDILVIGEYYYHNYSAQPFNSKATKKLANVLYKYKDKYRICIRPRTNDEYYDDMHNILGNNVKYSFPKNEITNTTTLFDDIMSSKIVLSTFSGGIHDSLLLHKPVIQTNFIGIREPKGFNIDNAVYYTDTTTHLENIIDEYFDNKLTPLEYDKNNEYYFYGGIFDIDKVKKIIHEYI